MTATLLRRSLAVLGLLALSGFSVPDVVAQSPAGRQKVTFVALGGDNQPIADLKSAQIELKIDGKVRPIRDLQLVKLGGAAPAGAGAPTAAPSGLFDSPVPPPYGENAAAAAPGRNVMIVVDEESLRPGADRPMKEAIDQFLGMLGPTDRAGIAGIPKITTRVDPTTNRGAVREALGRLAGRLPPNRDSTQDRCHARDALQDLSTVVTTLGEGPTTVVVFSSGMASPSNDKGECELTTTEFDRTRQAVASSRAIVYVAIPETTASQGELSGLQNLAGSVGSPLLNVAGADPVLTKVFRESGNYYVAEVDVNAAEHDGKSHRLDLKVTAPGATVRAPTEVLFAKAAASGAKLAAKDLVKDGKSYSDLPIRVVGYVSRASGPDKAKVKVLALVTPVDPAVKFSSVSIGFFDPTNKGQSYNVPSDDLAKPVIFAVLELAPGPWRVHAAVVDAAGKAGTADYQVDAQLTPAGPMTMSGLMLGVNGPNGFMPQIAYTNETEVVGHYELYGTTQAGLKATFELATTPDGPAIKDVQPDLKPTSEPGRYLVYGVFDVKDLKPGDYVIRATFQVEGTPAGKVIRTLRKLK